MGVPDPIFTCELALELKMPVGELTSRMSAHELGVVWPAFFRHRERERERAEKQQEMKQARKRNRR
jgi:hypothetical protein